MTGTNSTGIIKVSLAALGFVDEVAAKVDSHGEGRSRALQEWDRVRSGKAARQNGACKPVDQRRGRPKVGGMECVWVVGVVQRMPARGRRNLPPLPRGVL